MTVKITAANGGSDSLDFGCAQTAIVATVTGTEVSSGEGKLELKTTTGGTSAAKMTINGAGLATFTGATTTAGTVTASGDMKFNSGYGSAVVAYGCRAWVNFNGTGTVAIREDGNVSSITDNGTGDYTVNFAVAMPDINYSPSGTTSVVNDGGSTPRSAIAECATLATGSVRIIVSYHENTKLDSAIVSVQIFR
jgi:hypothetical protein